MTFANLKFLLSHPKGIDILLCIYRANGDGIDGRGISRKVDITTGFIYMLAGRLESLGLLHSERIGRFNILKLTPKGVLVVESFLKLDSSL